MGNSSRFPAARSPDLPTLTAAQKKTLTDAWRDGWRVAPSLSVSQWAEQSLELPAAITNLPGPLDLDRTPYVREIVDSYTRSDVETIVIQAGAQVAKTLIQQICLGYSIAHKPASSILVMPNEPDAKDFSKTRLLPLFFACDEIAAEIENPKLISLLSMKFRRCNLNIVGSNSPSRLASRPAANLYLDEVDKYADATNKEASAFHLATNRSRSFPGRKKHLITSTPTVEEGTIHQEFLNGDQRYYFIPCPHCGEFQKLDWMNVRWPESCRHNDGEWDLDQVKASAFYQCAKCRGRIDDDAKRAALVKGEWRPTAEGSPGVRSYHLSGLYPIWAEWGSLAVEWLKKKRTLDGLRDFLNSVLGLAWKQRVESAEPDEVMARVEQYPTGTCPFEPLEIIITADRQDDGFWYVVRAHTEGDRSAKLEDGFVETYAALLEVAKTEYRGPSGPLFITVRAIDSGDETDEVYEFCRKHGWQPLKGDGKGQQTFPSKFMPNDACGRLLIIKTEFCKEALERKLRINSDDPGGWMLDAGTNRRYADHLTSEKKVKKRDRLGGEKEERIVTGANHLLDCEAYQIGVAYQKRVHVRKLPPAVTPPSHEDEEDKPFVKKPRHFKEDFDDDYLG